MQKKIEPRLIVDIHEAFIGYVTVEDGKLVSYTKEVPCDRNRKQDSMAAFGKPRLKGGRFFPRRINDK